MSSVDSSLSDMQRAMKDALHTHWKLFILHGAVMIILGVLAVVAPVVATVAIDLFVGWLFLLSGGVGLVAMFSANDVPAFLWSLLTSALSIVVGVLLVWKPVEGAVSLTLVLTALFVAEGLFQIVTSIAYRAVIPGSWGWMLVSGIVDLALAAIIIAGWPMTATWTLGLLVGINLITSGWAIVTTAYVGRNVVESATMLATRARP